LHEREQLADPAVVIVKHEMRGILNQSLHVEVKQVMLKQRAQAFRALENGIKQLRQKETVKIIKAIRIQSSVGMATAVIHDQIIPGGQHSRLPVKRVLNTSPLNVSQLQKGVVVHRDPLGFAVLNHIKFISRENRQNFGPSKFLIRAHHKNAPSFLLNVDRFIIPHLPTARKGVFKKTQTNR
jgi:hypothetical protein